MQIKLVEIGNFRKLQKVRIDLAEKTTVFVGANNSGKTSAMVALRHFLVGRTDFSINDFTLSNWAKLDALGQQWEAQKADEVDPPFDWNTVLPHLDVWLDVQVGELHYVQKILPTLDWAGALIGVRLRYEPKDDQAFKAAYLNAKLAAEAVMRANAAAEEPPKAVSQGANGFALWPRSLMDFLSVKLRSMFEVRAYLLDPAKLVLPKGGIAAPQALPAESEPVEGDPLKTIIRIDEISAQRGFGFAPATTRSEGSYEEGASRGGKKLSSQLRHYYTQHLDPFDQPEPKDLEALQALHGAQSAFGKRLEVCFADALQELEQIGYPGVADPKLTITANIKPVDGLNHASAVQYVVPTHQSAGAGHTHQLPEDSNGLGYQNLVSIIFALMSFRDKWMRVGKAGKMTGDGDELIPPLHLVLIEEPEAHLHAQVQQVFIRQAYEVLRKHESLKASKDLCTQLVVSTHSSHLAHEAEFTSLRYFRRLPVKAEDGSVPVSCVVNLSETFGTEDGTARFVKRYLKATHCDLFFADGAILVEGPAERILVPHFVRSKSEYEFIRRCYVTWLEIGGSHAHRLKSLIEHLGLNTLIITDIDAKNAAGSSVPPTRGASLKARNETLKSWVPKIESLDALLDTEEADLALWDSSGYGVRVAYQQPISAKFKTADTVELLANTFEDALVYENLETFKEMDGTGLMGRLRKSIDDATDAADLAKKFAVDLGKGGKAEFAMELLYSKEIDTMAVPAYIRKGLLWLAAQLKRKEDDVLGKESSTISMLVKPTPKGPVTDPVAV
ncbi:AAA family ATPase [Burkholderia diffusa]|uniref:ATP-dependent OLD family endonuclease n=1 Tax=Burkholderia diffusa TaxID=488732 RepID=A0A6P2JBR5_9BURK|nr:AAA family ATPase [Burkholderia diffusa]KAB0659229.1 AAA family ATPase [Burkholderia diffusa]MBM2653379.1 AAA family ATPase [Burkholderia diffusa]VWB39042.1 ATP-dependent OLD family endonuclease [Burkholderia diffusa]